jgi:predicted nucleic acid-binding protein
VHEIEIGTMDDAVERERLLSTLSEIGQRGTSDIRQVRQRAEEWTERGLGPADAAHLAFAEAAQAGFVSCDDRLLRLCQRIQPNV